MKIPDELTRKYLLLVTDVDDEQIETLCDVEKTHPRDAKEALGKAIVRRYYDDERADRAAAEFRRIYTERKLPSEIPEVAIPVAELEDGSLWIVRLVALAEFAKSNSEARRLVRQGAVSIDDEKVKDMDARVTVSGGEVLRVGKRRFARLRVE